VELLRKRAPTVLLVVLVALFVVYPVADRFDNVFSKIALDALFVMVLLAALHADQKTSWWRTPGALLVYAVAALRLGVTALRFVLGPDVLLVLVVLSELATAVAVFYLSIQLLRRLTRGGRIDADTIAGASAVYVLFAIAFSNLYMAVFFLEPGNSAFGDAGLPSKEALVESDSPLRALGPTFTYFSVVTQTTLGYGDITPKSTIARGLAISQTIVGQLYLAILLARLVAMELGQRKPDGGE
jgi:hypothetical protein